jgi:hypothetical protein
VKSREDRQREVRRGGIWVLAVVTSLLLVYVLITGTPTWVGAMAPLIAASAALGGVYLGSRLSQRQREEEDERKRRALATLLLHEVRLLSIILKDIHRSGELHMEAIEPFHTAMYDQAGAELLRLTPETVDRLTYFYQLVHTLQMELNRFRVIPPDQRQWHNAALRVRATQTALAMQETVQSLTAEGGVWPRPFPSFTIRGYPPIGPDFPPSPFESEA